MKTINKKSYDCVKEVRKQRDQIAKDLDGMTKSEILDYFAKKRRKSKLIKPVE